MLGAVPVLGQNFVVTDGGHGVSTVTVVPLQTDDYTGPSPFSNPRLRDYYGPAGVNVAPPLAAELDRRINAQGKMTTTHGKTYFASGEFSGKTLGQAINIITDQFYNPPVPGYHAGLDRDGSNAAFFNEQRQQREGQQIAQTGAPQATTDGHGDVRAESARRALQMYPDAGKPDSRLTAKIREVSERLRATNDPILQSPSFPLFVTQIAASELGVLPKRH